MKLRKLIHNPLTKTTRALYRHLLGKIGHFRTIDWLRLHPELVDVIEESESNWLYSNTKCCTNQQISSRDYLFKFKNASCVAYSDIIIMNNGDYFCDIKNDAYIGKTADISDNQICPLDNVCTYDIRLPDECSHIEEAIYFSGLFSWNYYHYTFSVISRLCKLNNIPHKIPLLIDESVSHYESFSALLHICNTTARPVLVMKTHHRYCVTNLYVCSSTLLLEPQHKSHTQRPTMGVRYEEASLQFLRQTILPAVKLTQKKFPKRIFLGRAKGLHRSFNEDECIACASVFGFEIVYPEQLSFIDQVTLFANAEYIMGGTGAAFTNLIYTAKECEILVLYGVFIDVGLWDTLAHYTGANMHYLCDRDIVINDSVDLHQPYHIDIEELRKCLTTMIR